MAVAEWIPKSLLRRWTSSLRETEGSGSPGSEKQGGGRTQNEEGFQTEGEGVRRQDGSVVGDIEPK